MKRLPYIIVVSILGISFSGLNAQDPVQAIWSQLDSIHRNVQLPIEKESINPWSLHTTVGTSFSFIPKYGSVTNMFIAPHVNYSATDRLAFQGGIMLMQQIPLMNNMNQEFVSGTSFSNMSIFVSASYQLTDNLSFHGSGIKSLNAPIGNQNITNVNFQDLSIGATYDFGNFSIGASIHRIDNAYLRSPFGYYNNPYGSSLLW